MDKQELQQEIKRRQEEGRKLFHPAKIVAMKRGREHPKKHGSDMVFNDSVLEIWYDTYAPNLHVNYRQESVLIFHLGTLTRYIPGEWTEYLQELAEPLLLNEKAERLAEERERERKYLASWGVIIERT